MIKRINKKSLWSGNIFNGLLKHYPPKETNLTELFEDDSKLENLDLI